MIKDFNMIWEILRGTPIINLIIISSYFFIHPTYSSFYLLATYNINHVFNYILKEYIARPIYDMFNTDYIPLIGRGPRPPGAINCGSFLSLKSPISKSFGMPSGHSQLIWGLNTYLILTLIYNQIEISNNGNLNNLYNIILASFLVFVSILVSYSRIYKHNCHTLHQVVIGGIIGILYGLVAYYYKNSVINFFQKLNIFKN